jgi:hypothetical protein
VGVVNVVAVAWVNMGPARDAVVGQKMKRHLADSCAFGRHLPLFVFS